MAGIRGHDAGSDMVPPPEQRLVLATSFLIGTHVIQDESTEPFVSWLIIHYAPFERPLSPYHISPMSKSNTSMAESPQWSEKHDPYRQDSNKCGRDVFSSKVGQEYLCQLLNDEAQERQQATPECSSSDDDDTPENYKSQCKVWHDHFAEHEIDQCRRVISERHYWKIEFEHYLSSLITSLHGQDTSQDGEATAQHWRDAAALCKNFLQQCGQSSEQTTKLRYSIVDNKYWRPEAEVLQQRAALKEHDMREAAQENRNRIQRQRQARVQRCLESSGAISTSSTLATRPSDQPSSCVANRTRSRTTTDGRIIKHKTRCAVVGARAAGRRQKRGMDPGRSAVLG